MITHYTCKNATIILQMPMNIFYLTHQYKLNVIFQLNLVLGWRTAWHTMGQVKHHSACWMNGAVRSTNWSCQPCGPFYRITVAQNSDSWSQVPPSRPSNSLIGTVSTWGAYCSSAGVTAPRWTKKKSNQNFRIFHSLFWIKVSQRNVGFSEVWCLICVTIKHCKRERRNAVVVTCNRNYLLAIVCPKYHSQKAPDIISPQYIKPMF